ncbi:TIM barrel protein, partial [uncultured Holdemanella sp.]|uniref:TIM barrel protein n=1 Tax=uncultured Holdemanella sp. TaxID=1763549 RepID=UPI0035A6ECA4
MIYLGCHVSFKAPHYFKGAIEEAVSYGANACMIYTGPPSNTRRVDVSKLKIEEAKTYMLEHDFSIDRVIVHAPNIINLAKALKPETAEFGRDFLKSELERVQAIGAKT